MRNPESDMPNLYCPFVVFLGFFGILIFIGYGLMSKRFRQGCRGEKAAMAAKYKVKEDVKKSPSSLSRPLTSVSMVQSSDDNSTQGNEVQDDVKSTAEVHSVTTIVEEESEKSEMDAKDVEGVDPLNEMPDNASVNIVDT